MYPDMTAQLFDTISDGAAHSEGPLRHSRPVQRRTSALASQPARVSSFLRERMFGQFRQSTITIGVSGGAPITVRFNYLNAEDYHQSMLTALIEHRTKYRKGQGILNVPSSARARLSGTIHGVNFLGQSPKFHNADLDVTLNGGAIVTTGKTRGRLTLMQGNYERSALAGDLTIRAKGEVNLNNSDFVGNFKLEGSSQPSIHGARTHRATINGVRQHTILSAADEAARHAVDPVYNVNNGLSASDDKLRRALTYLAKGPTHLASTATMFNGMMRRGAAVVAKAVSELTPHEGLYTRAKREEYAPGF